MELGYRVPRFVVFTEQEITGLTDADITAKLDGWQAAYFAVRSSADCEDGAAHSFAGQFDTALYVQRPDLLATIQRLSQAKHSDRVRAYLQARGLAETQVQLALIVQEMVAADVSGVGFGKNPVKPYKNEQVVSAVFGVGEGLVSGALDADTFTRRNDGTWAAHIATKQQRLAWQDGTRTYQPVAANHWEHPTLNPTQLAEVAHTLAQLEAQLGSPQDIEFCYSDEVFHLLQSRPITTLNTYQQHVVWDNSNIVESYPGITLPFTFSFILKIYESVYYNFALMLGVPPRQLAANGEVFAEMLGHIHGRVYYHLIHWYKALAMLPAYQINAAYMEKMMGVAEPLGVAFTLRQQPGKWAAYWNMTKTAFRLLRTNAQLPRQKKAFAAKVSAVIKHYKSKDYTHAEPADIWRDYRTFKQLLVNEWTPPLANDLFAMIYFGTLEKCCTQWLQLPHLHTQLVVGRYPLKSVEPANWVNKIIQCAEIEDRLALLRQLPEAETWARCQAGKFGDTGQHIIHYIAEYGDRSIGELKLENETFTQNPTAFITILKSYRQSAAHTAATPADAVVVSRGLPLLKRLVFRYVARKAAETVADRENLRFDRTFGFGTVRMFLWHIGQRWAANGTIAHFKDIFYLEEQEVDDALYGRLSAADLRATIGQRQAAYAEYARSPTLPARIHQVDGVLDLDEPTPAPTTGQLHGIPCCAGIVTGRVRLLSSPNDVKSLDGDILVTTSTDPGWITIFQSASAILVERGSPLSHAAIVSRELGIPCIVGIKGITRILRTGDLITLNGQTGTIERHEAPDKV